MNRLMERARMLPEWQLDAIGLGVCALLGAAWYLTGYAPLASTKAHREALQAEVDEMRGRASHLSQLHRGYDHSIQQVKQQIASQGVNLEPSDQLLKRMSAMTAAAGAAGLTLDETKPGVATLRSKFTTVPIHMTGTGTFLQCTTFLHGLRGEKFRDTGVVGFTLHGEPAQSEKPARFSLELVWYAAKAAPPSLAAPPEAKATK